MPGFEGPGGGFIREGLAISFMQGIQDRRQWIMVAKREVGRDGRNAVWLATDAARGTAKSAESLMAFGCLIIGSGTEESQTGLIGVVGSERVGSQGMLRAELAWQLAEAGSLTAVTQPVACYDESERV